MRFVSDSLPGLRWAARFLCCALVLGAVASVSAETVSQEPATPATPATGTPPAATGTPEVKAVAPPRVAASSDTTLKITGRNFGQGTKVSFANPAIRVLGVKASSNTELTAHIKVAQNAAPGRTSLYVVNPDDTECETPFEVTAKVSTRATKPKSSASSAAAQEQRFEAYHLGNPAEVFQTKGKLKGALIVSAGKLRYEEGSKVLFNVPLSEVKEVEINSIGGFNTGTFHVFLKSGKTYQFAPASLHPADNQKMVDALRKMLSR